MNRKHIATYIITLWLTMFAAGCNNDVFIDGEDLPNEQSFTIEGDGGEVTFRIPTKELKSIYFMYGDVISYGGCTYYDLNGNASSAEVPASQISKIVRDNGFSKTELIKNGDKITAKSYSNPWDEGTLTVSFDYGYTRQYIKITVLPGKPIELKSVEYDGYMEINFKAAVKTSRTGFTNDGPLPQIYEERPFINQPITTNVELQGTGTTWPYYEKITMPVPVFENGKWEMKEKPEIRLGDKNTHYRSDQVDYKVEVDIPAYSSINIFTDVIYTQATARGVLNFINSTLNRNIHIKFTVTAKYPADYEIRVEDANK